MPDPTPADVVGPLSIEEFRARLPTLPESAPSPYGTPPLLEPVPQIPTVTGPFGTFDEPPVVDGFGVPVVPLPNRPYGGTGGAPPPPASAPPSPSPTPPVDRDLMLRLAGSGGGVGAPSRVGVDDAAERQRLAVDEQAASLRAQAEAARAAGEAEAQRYAGVADEARRIAEQHDAERAEASRQRDEMLRNWKAATASERDASRAEVRTTVLGELGGALAVALGAFGSALSGGPNAALQVLDRKAAERVDQQERLLRAAGMQVDRAKEGLGFAYKHLGDLDAARSAALAELYGASAEQAKRYQAVVGSQERAAAAQNIEGELRARQAAHEAEAARKLYEARLKANRGSGAMGRLKLEEQALKNAKLMQEVTGATPGAPGVATGSPIEDKLSAAEKTRMMRVNSAQEGLASLKELLLNLKAKGYTAVPGHERTGVEPVKLARRLATKYTLIGGALAPGRGETGLTPEEQQVTDLGNMVAQSNFAAASEGQNTANVGPERERAEAAVFGNYTIDGMLSNLERMSRERDAQARSILRPYGDTLVSAYEERLKQRGARFPTSTSQLGEVKGWDEAVRAVQAGGAPTGGPLTRGSVLTGY